jgi:hypothetical protein
VTVAPERDIETVFASGSEGSSEAPWTAPGRRLLATLRIGKSITSVVVALPPRPPKTSPAVNRLLQVVSLAAILLIALFTALYVREVRHGG